MLADSAAMAVQYGHKQALCEAVLKGIGPRPSDQQLMEGFMNFTSTFWGRQFAGRCVGGDVGAGVEICSGAMP
jgi:hypothetical protein